MASTRVVLPWSTWATIATLRRSLRMAVAMDVFLTRGVRGGARDVARRETVYGTW
jgi:hypothetical protein